MKRRGISQPAVVAIAILIVIMGAVAGYYALTTSSGSSSPPTTTTYTNPSDDVRNWTCDQIATAMNQHRAAAEAYSYGHASNDGLLAVFYENWYIYKHC